ncbi:MAG TPA: TonB-dependent receptor, partial [Flavobacteriaceae bacterium]|nr:TonB-dependent receptor [Flavobacteriaceae bacterium]
VTTSDAGAGVGYTGIRVRGSSAMNVTINGIPYNDSESQGTFWVNLGDIASSVESLQLQRGVGTSTNGSGAFGSSLNLKTQSYRKDAFASIANSYGSFNTHKHTVEFGTGLFNEHWAFSGRLSKIESDGYIDRASSDLKSYFLQGVFTDENTLVKALTFGGKERTYQAWFGIDSTTLSDNRTYNPAGKYTDENGNVKFYENQTDNYAQDHFQLLWNQQYNAFWSSNIALHYTYGRGYYEEYEEDAVLTEYGLEPFIANGMEMTTSDLVDRSWLDNDFYGAVFSVNYKKGTIDALLGGGWNKYVGDHFGEVIYTRFAQNNDPYEPYYLNTGKKTDANVFGKINWAVRNDLAIYADLQVRAVHYETEGPLADGSELLVDDNFTFFNPKFGVTYQLNTANQFYFSFAHAHREPNRTDYENGNPVPEKLNDFELGWRFGTEKIKLNTNAYFMGYQDQLVLTGAIDEEGAPIRKNSGKSYRLGLEVNADISLVKKLSIHPAMTVSRNKNMDFVSQFNGVLTEFGDTDISFSPSVIASNIIRYEPIENLELSLLSKYVGEQYMSNIETEASVLESYFTNDFNVQYTWENAPWFKEIVFTGLVNNIFDVEYVSNGYYFSYDVEDPTYPSGFQTVEGAGYYPQAGINFLVGVILKF